MNFWVVLGGENYKFVSEALRESTIGVGYDMVERLEPGITKEEIIATYARTRPEYSRDSAARRADLLLLFNQIAKDDLVLMPVEGPFARVGRIRGGYEYVPDTDFRHRKRTSWSGTRIRRSDLPDKLQTVMELPPAVKRVDPDSAEAVMRLLPRRWLDDPHPEFEDLAVAVWDGLGMAGRQLGQIPGADHSDGRGVPDLAREYVWHDMDGICSHVCGLLGLDIGSYGAAGSGNALYDSVAEQIGALLESGALVDAKGGAGGGIGSGIWRLDGARITELARELAEREMEAGDYGSAGHESAALAREKQGRFRKMLLQEHGGRCCLCGFGTRDDARYLVGAHIVPYSVMRVEDKCNSMNPSNGLLLCRLCDVAFESGDIRVGGDYLVRVKKSLRDGMTGAAGSWLGSVKDRLDVRDGSRHGPDPYYLEWKTRLLGVGGPR